jgi:succinoglycan biosynthesis transport protein ExoP
MSLEAREYVLAFRAHRRFFLYTVACFVALAAGLAFTRPTVYEARTQFFVSPGADMADPSQAYQGALFAQQRVVTYTQIVKGPAVASAVIADLRLTLTPEQFASKVEATVPLNSTILDVTVRDRSARTAGAIARGLSETFPPYVTSLERPRADAGSPVKVTVTSPLQPATPASRHGPLELAIGLVLGLGIGAGASLLLDSKARSTRQERRRSVTPFLGVNHGRPLPDTTPARER